MPSRVMLDFDLADDHEAWRKAVPDKDATAERALWCAVLEQAVRDARGGLAGDSKGTRRANQLGAIEWLKSNRTSIGSLRWIIDQTGLPTTQQVICDAVTKRMNDGKRLRVR